MHAPADATLAIVIDAAVAVAPADPPCSKAAIGAPGDEQKPRIVDLDDCRLNEEHVQILNIDDIASQAALGGAREGAPQPSHMRVVRQSLSKDVFAIEAKSAADLKWLLRCDRPIRVDWKRQHPWVLVDSAVGGQFSVAATFDDGATTTLALQAAFSPCSGAQRDAAIGFSAVFIPVGRELALRNCVEPPRAPCPQGMP